MLSNPAPGSNGASPNRRNVLLGSIASLVTASACASPLFRDGADFLIEDVSVIPMHEEVVLHNRSVAVSGDTIAAVRPAAELRGMPARHRIDGRGLFLMPALTDLHVHVEGEPERDFPLYLANGITTVRNMSDRDYDHRRIRADLFGRRLEGPRYLLSGPSLHEGNLSAVDAIPTLLDRHVALGYGTVKIHGELSAPVFDALIEGARRRGLLISGHAQRRRDLAVTLRMDSIEHCEEFIYVPGREALDDEDRAGAIARQIAESGIRVCPSLAVFAAISDYLADDRFGRLGSREELRYLPRATREQWLGAGTNPYRTRIVSDTVQTRLRQDVDRLLRFTGRLHQAGVPLVLGTDAMGALVPGFAVHDELGLLVRAGLSPYEALKTATISAAVFLGEQASAGSIQPGKRADLILLASDPLQNIASAAQLRGLMTGGRWYGDADIRALLDRVLSRPDPAPTNYPRAGRESSDAGSH